jgi:uncharacterized spore protein YtfJ
MKQEALDMDSVRGSSVLDTLTQAVDAGGAGRVFGTPITQGDVIMLPVARISGGGGGGGGAAPADHNGKGTQEGSGGGFGTSARGLGVIVLKDGQVTWRPAVDVNRIVLGGQIVAIVALLVARSVLKSRSNDGAGWRLPWKR